MKTYGKKGNSVFLDRRYNRLLQTFDYMLNGKVIGEYVCDEIETVIPERYPFSEIGTCLTPKQIMDYGGNKPIYFWHISNLKIYDKPKELSEFRIIDKEYLTKCPYRSRIYNNPDYTNGALLKGSYVCIDDGEPDFCRGQCENAKKPLTRPPQSWCYTRRQNNESGCR